MPGERDHYDVLGVAPTASAAEIRQAYRRLARRYHPDVGPGGDARRFEELSDAYEVLHDAVRRARYDESLTAGPAVDGAAARRPDVSVPRRRRDVPRFLDDPPPAVAPAPARVRVIVWRAPAGRIPRGWWPW